MVTLIKGDLLRDVVLSKAIASLSSAEARSTPGGSAESIASLGSAEARSTPGGSAESIAIACSEARR